MLAAAGGATAAGSAPLEGAIREVQDLQRRYRNVTAVFPTAAPPDSGLPVDFAGFDAIHLAAHARVDDERPWNSEIRFGGRDGLRALCARQIAALELPAHLTVLASCESAGGALLSGEGLLGLTSAFLIAGVPAVVASLWPVDDAATARLMGSFYAELAAGRSVADALHVARSRLREHAETAHPFYWSGFVLIGDGDVHIPLRQRRTAPRWIVPSAFILGGLGLLAPLLARRPARRAQRQRRFTRSARRDGS
jgi:CHAT domain-containing protein